MLQFGTTVWPKMRDGFTALNARYFNPIYDLIDKRLHAVEQEKGTLDGEIEKFQTLGLDRINQVLGPAFETVSKAAELGFLVATSTTSATITEGNPFTLTLPPEEAVVFIPTAWMIVGRLDNADDYAVVQLDSYVRESGSLSFTVVTVAGSGGPHSDWYIAGMSGSDLAGRAHRLAAEAARDLALAYRDTASGHAATATTQAGVSTTQAGIATTQAGIATTQAGIATTKANEAAASAIAAALFDPSSYYTKSESDAALAAETGAREAAIIAEAEARAAAINSARTSYATLIKFGAV